MNPQAGVYMYFVKSMVNIVSKVYENAACIVIFYIIEVIMHVSTLIVNGTDC